MNKKFQPLLIFILLAIASSSLSYFSQPFIHNNEKATDIIINVFSILAGFLIAIMTLFADLKFDDNANWRQLTLKENLNNQRYTKHSFLFYSYLVTLILVFITILLKSKKCEYDNTITLLEYSYLFFACISIFYSFSLPSKLIQYRQEVFNKVLENKKPKKLG